MFSDGDELYESLSSSCEKLKVNCDELFEILRNVKDWNTLLAKVFEHLLAQNRAFRTGKLDRGRAMLTLIKEMQRRGISPEGDWDIQRLIKDFNKLARDKISGWSSRHSAEMLNSFFKAMGLESRLVKKGNTWDVRVNLPEPEQEQDKPIAQKEQEEKIIPERRELWTISVPDVSIEVPKIIEQEYEDALSLFVSRIRTKTKKVLEDTLALEDMPSIILKPRR
ncbi:MAG: hypothetical protein QW733_01815 [Desulfurococcaceae archaeon]